MIEYIELAFYGLCVISALASGAIAAAPPSLTSKIPNWIMITINVLAINVKNAKNMTTDIKGNVYEDIKRNSKSY